jgi:hypothetical protein
VQRHGQAGGADQHRIRTAGAAGHHPGKVYSRDDILARLRGQPGQDIHSRAVDILVSRLRKKLEPLDAIHTLRNAGYLFAGARRCEAGAGAIPSRAAGGALSAAGAGTAVRSLCWACSKAAAPAAGRTTQRPLVADYVDRLAAQIGSPPDVQRAQALTQRLPITVRIEGPQVSGDSHPEPARERHWRGDPSGELGRRLGLLARTTADGHRVSFGLAAALDATARASSAGSRWVCCCC